jgi:hypothetical protein
VGQKDAHRASFPEEGLALKVRVVECWVGCHRILSWASCLLEGAKRHPALRGDY